MTRAYWLDLFTGKTWEEFLRNGANVSGFRTGRRGTSERVKPGDYFLCYMTGISRFVGVLEVKSTVFSDESKIWEDEVFPLRFKVEVVHKLEPATGVPVLSLRDKLSIFRNLKTPNLWSGHFRGSPAEFPPQDGVVIVDAIREATLNPVPQPYDEKKYRRSTPVYESKQGSVTIPQEVNDDLESEESEAATHQEIQYLLLKLGSDLGLDVWVARNDRNKSFNGHAFRDVPRIRDEIPVQFDEATNSTIELIDVIWIQGDAIVAAFEVEHSTAVYSGLLRMADLISMQPNIAIDLYLVAPDDRRNKVLNEVNRPTFARLRRSLPKVCKFIPYSELKREMSEIEPRIQYMKPEFIKKIAESCELDEA